MRFKTAVACSAAFVAAAVSANAVGFLPGSRIGYGGLAAVGGAGPTLAIFPVGIVLGTPTGDFSTITGPLTLEIALTDGAIPASPIWDDGTYSFTATAPISIVPAGGGFYNVTTSGFVDDGPGGLDPTPANFALALTPIQGGPFGFYGAGTFHGVPEPSTYALLAGLGLVGFAGYRRFRS